MTYEEFRKANPAIRQFMALSSEQRANHAASFRLGYQQRQRQGDYFYTHPACPGLSYPTAKAATTAAYRTYNESMSKPEAA